MLLQLQLLRLKAEFNHPQCRCEILFRTLEILIELCWYVIFCVNFFLDDVDFIFFCSPFVDREIDVGVRS